MNCKNCGAPVKLVPDRDYFYCEYCSSLYSPEGSRDGVRLLEEFGDLVCPVCQSQLVKASLKGTRC